MSNANPPIHGMLAYGYEEKSGVPAVFYQTSWAIGEERSAWTADIWQAWMPVRGVIGFHPRPKIRSVSRENGQITMTWDGPSAQLHDAIAGTTQTVHRYQLERASSLNPGSFTAVGSPTTDRTITVPETPGENSFYRVSLVAP
jgi:hypothetical protein